MTSSPCEPHCWSYGQGRWRGHHWQWPRARLHQYQHLNPCSGCLRCSDECRRRCRRRSAERVFSASRYSPRLSHISHTGLSPGAGDHLKTLDSCTGFCCGRPRMSLGMSSPRSRTPAEPFVSYAGQHLPVARCTNKLRCTMKRCAAARYVCCSLDAARCLLAR